MARRLPPIDLAKDPWVENLEGLGLLVRQARAQSRMRIDDAAAFCGVSVDVLSRLENGKSVTTDRLFKVLDGFGLNLLVVSKEKMTATRGTLREDGP